MRGKGWGGQTAGHRDVVNQDGRAAVKKEKEIFSKPARNLASLVLKRQNNRRNEDVLGGGQSTAYRRCLVFSKRRDSRTADHLQVKPRKKGGRGPARVERVVKGTRDKRVADVGIKCPGAQVEKHSNYTSLGRDYVPATAGRTEEKCWANA